MCKMPGKHQKEILNKINFKPCQSHALERNLTSTPRFWKDNFEHPPSTVRLEANRSFWQFLKPTSLIQRLVFVQHTDKTCISVVWCSRLFIQYRVHQSCRINIFVRCRLKYVKHRIFSEKTKTQPLQAQGGARSDVKLPKSDVWNCFMASFN